MIWESGLTFWEQSEETRTAVFDAMNGAPLTQSAEPVDGVFSRVLWQMFNIDGVLIIATYVYVNAANSNEWAALKNIKIEKV